MSLPRLRIEGKRWDHLWRIQIGGFSCEWRQKTKSYCWIATGTSGYETFLYGPNKKEVIRMLREIYVEQNWKVKKHVYS
jgi:hypothetical protein